MKNELLHEAFAPFSQSADSSNNYLKKSVWTLQGDCIIAASEDKCIRCFPLPAATYYQLWHDVPVAPAQPSTLVPSFTLKEHNHIYDIAMMNKGGLGSKNVLLASCRNLPIHLWDLESLKCVTSYMAKDGSDESVAALCICPEPFSGRLFAGYDGFVQVFDLECPAKCVLRHKLMDPEEGKAMRTLVAGIAAHPDSPSCFAFGCYNRRVYLADVRSNEISLVLEGHIGGITHLKYSSNEHVLYSGARKDPNICAWDLRHTAKPLLHCYVRSSNTNQRMIFDVNEHDSLLAAGCCDGTVSVYDLGTNALVGSLPTHQDAVSCVQFSPISPDVMLTASGQRHYEKVSEKGKSEPMVTGGTEAAIEMSDDEPTAGDLSLRNGIRVWQIK